MGYDATSGEGNTTGQPLQTQALSFAGPTAKPQKRRKMEELTHISRNGRHGLRLIPELRTPTETTIASGILARRSLSGHISVSRLWPVRWPD